MNRFSEEPPHRVDIAPRPLTTEERALLDVLLDSPLASTEVQAQVDSAHVVGICSCGCRSIFLETFGDAALARFPDSLGPVEITAVKRTRNPDSWDGLTVKLHIVLGRIEELEIWGGTKDGTNEGRLPTPGELELIS